jgi:hypothetical protein
LSQDGSGGLLGDTKKRGNGETEDEGRDEEDEER